MNVRRIGKEPQDREDALLLAELLGCSRLATFGPPKKRFSGCRPSESRAS
jgi:hypothetical protein